MNDKNLKKKDLYELDKPHNTPFQETNDFELSSIFRQLEKQETRENALILLNNYKGFISFESRDAQLLLSFFVNDEDDEIRILTVLFFIKIFQRENDNMLDIFVDCGIAPILLPHFPKFKIPKCFSIIAYRSYFVASFLVENHFGEILLSFMDLSQNDLIDFINCIGSIGIANYDDVLISLIPPLLNIALSATDATIQITSLNALSKFISISENISLAIIKSEIFEIILQRLEINNPTVFDSLIEIIQNCFLTYDNLPQSLIEYFCHSLMIALDSSDEFLITNALQALATPESNDFIEYSKTLYIPEQIFDMFNHEHSWKLKSALFKLMCHFFNIADDKEYFQKFNFLNIFEMNAQFFVGSIPYSIAKCLKTIKICGDKSQLYKNFLNSSQCIYDCLEELQDSQDSEIQCILHFFNDY